MRSDSKDLLLPTVLYTAAITAAVTAYAMLLWWLPKTLVVALACAAVVGSIGLCVWKILALDREIKRAARNFGEGSSDNDRSGHR